MINLIKKEVKFVNVFAFVTDDGRWNSTTTNLIKIFEDNFGTGFWHHFAIVYTRWGFDSASEKRRKKAKISQAAREVEVREKINELFEASKVNKQIPVYFTDTFELEDIPLLEAAEQDPNQEKWYELCETGK